MTIVMLQANYWITPIWYQMPTEAVVPMLPLIALYNLLKAAINSVVVFFLYKRVSPFLHK